MNDGQPTPLDLKEQLLQRTDDGHVAVSVPGMPTGGDSLDGPRVSIRGARRTWCGLPASQVQACGGGWGGLPSAAAGTGAVVTAARAQPGASALSRSHTPPFPAAELML